ncbi:MAG: class I SAM-dependent methyltransferase [Saprospiraceae bacterium]|nr:class I SAM-dependent methyltransferase [Saprospiraceae bacterium]
MIKTTIRQVFRKFNSIGFVSFNRYIIKRVYYAWLQKKYGFDKWHSATPFEARTYKKSVVQLASQLGVKSVVEIGCGLGEIISRIDAQERIGVDRELAVIMAARQLNKSECKFFTMELVKFTKEFPNDDFELLIMVNWIHEISWKDLSQSIKDIQARFDVKYLLVDSIDKAIGGFQNYHDEERFSSLGPIVDMKLGLDFARSLYIINIEKINALG